MPTTRQNLPAGRKDCPVPGSVRTANTLYSRDLRGAPHWPGGCKGPVAVRIAEVFPCRALRLMSVPFPPFRLRRKRRGLHRRSKTEPHSLTCSTQIPTRASRRHQRHHHRLLRRRPHPRHRRPPRPRRLRPRHRLLHSPMVLRRPVVNNKRRRLTQTIRPAPNLRVVRRKAATRRRQPPKMLVRTPRRLTAPMRTLQRPQRRRPARTAMPAIPL
jgi:hypothetical protein